MSVGIQKYETLVSQKFDILREYLENVDDEVDDQDENALGRVMPKARFS